MKIIYIIFTFIFLKTLIYCNSIQAYEKGKAAIMDIEITKVKTNNFIDFFIDRDKKQIYKDITSSIKENKDLKKNLYITSYYKKSRNRSTHTLPYKIKKIENKIYLIVSYINEPKNIYLWILNGKDIEKLYTGIIKDYLNPLNPLSYIDLKNTFVIKGTPYIFKKNGYSYFKIANIKLKNSSNKSILLKTQEKYLFYDEKNKSNITYDIELFFKNNQSFNKITSINKNNSVEIYGKIKTSTLDTLKNRNLKIKNYNNSNFKDFSIDINFLNKHGVSQSLFFKNYIFNLKNNIKKPKILDIYVNPNTKQYLYNFTITPNKENTFSVVSYASSNITKTTGETCLALSQHNWNSSSNYFQPISSDIEVNIFSNTNYTNSFIGEEAHAYNSSTPFFITKQRGNLRDFSFDFLANVIGNIGSNIGKATSYTFIFKHSHKLHDYSNLCPNDTIRINFDKSNPPENIKYFYNNMDFKTILKPLNSSITKKETSILGIKGNNISSLNINANLVKNPIDITHETDNKITIPVSLKLSSFTLGKPSILPSEIPNDINGFFSITGSLNIDNLTKEGIYNGFFQLQLNISEKDTGGKF